MKYCLIDYGGADIYYIKIDEYVNNEIYAEYSICKSDCVYDVNDVFNIFSNTKISEIYFSDIVEYLPENHPDKIIYLRKERIKKLLNDTI